MNCPICKSLSKVYDSRNQTTYTYRRRKCLKCQYRYTTVEVEVGDLSAFRASKRSLDSKK
jgi:transcriptional regulator NrdR family protein